MKLTVYTSGSSHPGAALTIQLEQEVKFRLHSVEEGALKLRELGAEARRERHFETNTLYDFPDGRMSKRDEALRLRRVGDEAWLTWKGPHHGSGRIKQRRELETRVEDGDAVEGILEALGVEECFRYEKYRATYGVPGAILSLDETPIGPFLEIEGPPPRITELAAELGLDMAHAIHLSYPRLYERHRLETPDAPELMVFSPSPSAT